MAAPRNLSRGKTPASSSGFAVMKRLLEIGTAALGQGYKG